MTNIDGHMFYDQNLGHEQSHMSTSDPTCQILRGRSTTKPNGHPYGPSPLIPAHLSCFVEIRSDYWAKPKHLAFYFCIWAMDFLSQQFFSNNWSQLSAGLSC
jgi:hypothetical protein